MESTNSMRPRGRTAMSPLQGNGKERFSEILDAAALVFQEHAFDIAMQWRPEFAPGYARRTDQRPTVGSSCSEYRTPCTVTLERLRSMSRRSSGVRLISAALMFCSRRSSFVVPGIGTIYCFCAQVKSYKSMQILLCSSGQPKTTAVFQTILRSLLCTARATQSRNDHNGTGFDRPLSEQRHEEKCRKSSARTFFIS